ncbi:hypothetical protein OHC33_007237 [Knufia fluminis]|uniref:C2H2-type domain-containing protein n=1 Tax=Knufia fluminis TaxID=191047 RepID=A0AAN8I4D5_9EURO|nr:hypothetical protein OHC33_007237 [Knufia fluminis]
MSSDPLINQANPNSSDTDAYHEALRNEYSSEAAYEYSLQAALQGAGLLDPIDHSYTGFPSLEPQTAFEDPNALYDYSQGSPAYNSIEVDHDAYPPLFDNGRYSVHVDQDAGPSYTAYPPMPTSSGVGVYAYPEPPSPSAVLGLNSEWILPADDLVAELSSREATLPNNVPHHTPSPPSLIYTSSSPASTAYHQSPAQGAQSTTSDLTSEAQSWPDTYAGRRTAEARDSFPWECGQCQKKYLYENSAVKHWHQHHQGPANIIQRYDAPKRPAPGRPRNNKAAKSQIRRGVTPPVAAADMQARRQQTAPGSHAPRVHHPVLTYFVDGKPTNVTVAGAGASHDFITADSAAAVRQPDTESLFLSTIDPALLATPPVERLEHSRRHKFPVTAIVSRPFHTPSTPAQSSCPNVHRRIATLANQRPLSPLTPSNAPDTAQEALRGIRRLDTATAPNTAQAAILQSNPGLAGRHEAQFADFESGASRSWGLPRSPPSTIASKEPEETFSTTGAQSSVSLNTSQCQPDAASSSDTQPPLSPSGSNDQSKDKIILHPHYQRWYKCFDGVWKHWDNDVCGWVMGP